MTDDDLNLAAPMPPHLYPALQTPRGDGSVRTRDHRCGRCQWDGTGSTACRNYRPSQAVPYMEADDA